MANNFLSTLALLDGAQKAISALELSPGVPLFSEVKYFTSPDLLLALTEIRLFKKRVCLLIPSNDAYQNEIKGQALETFAERDLEILISDRDYGVRQAASTGDENTPGVIRMKDILEEKLLGSGLGLNPLTVAFRPLDGRAIVLKGPERTNNPGREIWHMTWRAGAGPKIVNIPNQP